MEESYYGEFEGKRFIRKRHLKKGAYYYGRCRNASLARWDGEKFWYWRSKFGSEFIESIHCPEDDDSHDLFFAQSEIWFKEIPLDEKQDK